MSLAVERSSPGAPEAALLLDRRQAWLDALFPPEEHYSLDAATLAGPATALFVARDGAAALGTAVLAERQGYGEVKSMFVAQEARGRGVGMALLARVEAEARARHLAWLRLETADNLPEAHRLYARAGFTLRGPFGDYPDLPSSIFMEKPLT